VFRDWVIANYLDDPKLSDGQYGYDQLTIHASPVTKLQRAPDGWQDTVHQYAADYVEILPSGSPTVTVTFQGSLTVPLVAGLAHSGRDAWWANRSDGGDTTLTRSFDLTGVTSATLNFWTWYDIEADWDYAYAEVSTDNGKTWDTLPGKYTTTTNPNGNSYGNAWTGQSVGATAHGPEWVEEQVDLTPYAGKQVLLRFEYITDDAFNAPGWLIDDIRIPELNYYDDVESGDGGWLAQGFVRSDDVLPQRWLVQVIDLGQQTEVHSLPVGPDGRGTLTIGGLGTRLDKAVVVVSALAPKTTEVGRYELDVQPVQP
jgi:immune inhibitor A